MRYVEQLVDYEQLTSLSYMVKYLKLHSFDGKRTLGEAVESLYARISERGFGAFFGNGAGGGNRGGAPEETGAVPGNLAMPRKQELYAALNRCRGLIHVEGKV